METVDKASEIKQLRSRAVIPSLVLAIGCGVLVWLTVFGFLQFHGDEVGMPQEIAIPAGIAGGVLTFVGAFVYYSRPPR